MGMLQIHLYITDVLLSVQVSKYVNCKITSNSFDSPLGALKILLTINGQFQTTDLGGSDIHDTGQCECS
jgi:hypothetical protein